MHSNYHPLAIMKDFILRILSGLKNGSMSTPGDGRDWEYGQKCFRYNWLLLQHVPRNDYLSSCHCILVRLKLVIDLIIRFVQRMEPNLTNKFSLQRDTNETRSYHTSVSAQILH